MSDTTTNTGGSAGLLQTAFIVLKLTGVIDWSWWWVLSPTLIPLGLSQLAFWFTLHFFGVSK